MPRYGVTVSFCLLVALFAVSTHAADTTTFWSIDLPVMHGGRNIEHVEELRFATKRVSYDIDVATTDGIYEFYNNYFEELGWKDPTKEFASQARDMPRKWSGYSMHFNEEGMPVATYGSIWEPAELPARGSATVTLTGYSDGMFSARVDIAISPKVDTTPLMKLQQLLGNDPRNFFILSQVVKGNPFEIDKIEILDPSEYDGDEPLIREYYEIIQQIMDGFAAFRKQYISK